MRLLFFRRASLRVADGSSPKGPAIRERKRHGATRVGDIPGRGSTFPSTEQKVGSEIVDPTRKAGRTPSWQTGTIVSGVRAALSRLVGVDQAQAAFFDRQLAVLEQAADGLLEHFLADAEHIADFLRVAFIMQG